MWLDRKVAQITGSPIVQHATRFSIAGVLNSAVSLLIYQSLLFVAPAAVAYVLAWTCGLLIVCALYPKHVFKRKGGLERSDRLLVVLCYLLSFLIGLGIIHVSEVAGIWDRLSIFVSIATTTVFNFLSMRYIINRRPDGANEQF